MTKSHVGIGYTLCPVCGAEHDEVVLLDTQLKDRLERRQAMGWGMCPSDQKLKDDGYISLIECRNKPHSMNEADRTGTIAHIRSNAWADLFGRPIPTNGVCFVSIGVIDNLRNLQEKT